MSPFELLVENYIFAGEMEGGGHEIILVGLLPIICFIKVPLKFFKILVEHVLATEFVPAAKMVDSHVQQHTMPLKNPVDLFFVAPHHVPVIIIGFSPLPTDQSFYYAIFIICFEFYGVGGDRIVLFFDISTEIF